MYGRTRCGRPMVVTKSLFTHACTHVHHTRTHTYTHVYTTYTRIFAYTYTHEHPNTHVPIRVKPHPPPVDSHSSHGFIDVCHNTTVHDKTRKM